MSFKGFLRNVGIGFVAYTFVFVLFVVLGICFDSTHSLSNITYNDFLLSLLDYRVIIGAVVVYTFMLGVVDISNAESERNIERAKKIAEQKATKTEVQKNTKSGIEKEEVKKEPVKREYMMPKSTAVDKKLEDQLAQVWQSRSK